MRTVLALVLCAGCGDVLATSDCVASFGLQIVDSRLTISALFYSTDASAAAQTLDDARVAITFRGREFEADRRGAGFVAKLDLDAPLVAEEPVSIALLREAEADAPTSTIALPGLITLDPVPLFISRAQDLTLSWQPITQDAMYWQEQGGFCLEYVSGAILAGTGTVTIPANTFMSDTSGTCTAELALTRTRRGVIDPAFADGGIRFTDEVRILFASTP